MSNIIYSDETGILRLYNGEVIYIVDIKYSSDGKTFLEKSYNPFPHNYEGDLAVTVEGHKYMHVKHAGDNFYQAPMYMTAKDGREVELRTENGQVQWGYVGDSEWSNLIDISTLKGETGDVGPQGAGLKIDMYGFYGIFKDSIPYCWANKYEPYQYPSETLDGVLYYSLGDGIHQITSADQVASKFYSEDGSTWLAIGLNDIGKQVRYIADDVLGTNSLDYRLSNADYGSAGKTYAFSPLTNSWELSNFTAGNPVVAPSFAKLDEGKFMEDYDSDTIGLDVEDNLEVKDESISVGKLKDGTFTHGLEEGATIKAKPSDFTGKGIVKYDADSDTEEHLQVDVDGIISDGLIAETLAPVDGELNKNMIVNVADLIDDTVDGLEAIAKGDSYSDLRVKTGDALSRDTKGVNVVADETTINALNAVALSVRGTDNNTLGIRKEHVNKDVVDSTAGLQKGDGTAGDYGGALKVKLDQASLGFDVDGKVEIAENGVQGTHLNDSTVNTEKGLQILSNAIAVKLANAGGLEFNASGEIIVSDVDLITGKAVKSLNGKVNEVLLTDDTSGAVGSGIDIEVDNTGAGIVLNLTVDENTLKSYLGITSGAFAPAVHTHMISDTTGLQAELDSKMETSTLYDTSKFQIHPIHGPIWKGATTWFRIAMSEAGNISTVAVTP